ncbi:hypothetical protein [Streptomyces sp. S.PB5]|uniref:hypothetical protein n=1 Tax=Streptomyces sp. S.PB5 TaxID=3020844 RepID=UPI0025B22259|nr:hypothetical protein [Streptomyces sp. S.PB5]
MKTTFEDRLLAELRGEIERREADTQAPAAPAPAAPAPAARRRLVTGRRLTLAAATCALAGLAVVLVPGSPADSPAYAVERKGDGTVMLTVKDQDIDVEAQRQLARKLSLYGIEVDIQVLRPGYVCEGDTVLWAVKREGGVTPLYVLQWNKETTLRRGNVLVFVNTNAGDKPHKVDVYPSQDDVEPCVQVKPTPNRS